MRLLGLRLSAGSPPSRLGAASRIAPHSSGGCRLNTVPEGLADVLLREHVSRVRDGRV